VFDPFFTTKSIGKGTGLGLSQVYGIATQSGGTARVETVVGSGTTVEIWLPISRGDDTARAIMLHGDQPLTGGAERILVVDDDPDVRRFIVTCLGSLGYEVIEAESGQSGLEKLASGRLHLVVVDYAMPGMTGAEMADTARRGQPGLPVLLVTGYADAHAIEKLASTESVLRKPFKVAELASAVRKAIEAAPVSVV
jgi:CheY-like chemotaxis protein